MGVFAVWDNPEKTVIRYDFSAKWTWEEFLTASTEAFAMTRSVEHIVDTITNFKPGAALPPHALFHFRRAMADAPKNRGINVIVSSSTFIKTIVYTFSRFNKQLGERLQLADSLGEARDLIQQRYKVT